MRINWLINQRVITPQQGTCWLTKKTWKKHFFTPLLAGHSTRYSTTFTSGGWIKVLIPCGRFGLWVWLTPCQITKFVTMSVHLIIFLFFGFPSSRLGITAVCWLLWTKLMHKQALNVTIDSYVWECGQEQFNEISTCKFGSPKRMQQHKVDEFNNKLSNIGIYGI